MFLRTRWLATQRNERSEDMEIFVFDNDWNAPHASVDEAVAEGMDCGDYEEGDEFKMVRLTVGAYTTYKIVDGKAVPIAVSFPTGLSSSTS